MAYARRYRRGTTRRTVRARPYGRKSVPRVPRVTKPRRPRMRRGARNQMALSKLSTAVARLTKQSFGYSQLSRHYLAHGVDPVHPTGTTAIYDLCSEQPVCWLHQAITERSNIYQVRFDSQAVPPTFNEQTVAVWAKQPFLPVQLGGPTYSEYDSQLFWGNSANSAGVRVENKFMLGAVGYDITLSALGVAGNVQLCMVYEKNAVTSQQNTEFPSAMRSFVNTTPLSQNQNVAYSRFWKVKVLKSHYFSCINIAGQQPNAPVTPHLKPAITSSTMSQKYWHVKVKSNSVITVSDTDALGGIINYREIPVKKRAWLMLRTSISERDISTAYAAGGATDHVAPGSIPYQRLQCSIQRTCSWRDATGASS